MEYRPIKSEHDLQTAFAFAAERLKSGPFVLEFKTSAESFAQAQRGLYHRWKKVFADSLGYTPDEMHDTFKEKYFLRVYINDPTNHPEFVGVAEHMATVRRCCDPGTYQEIRKLVLQGVSHMNATKYNMVDVLRQMEIDASEMGIFLPPPTRKGLL